MGLIVICEGERIEASSPTATRPRDGRLRGEFFNIRLPDRHAQSQDHLAGRETDEPRDEMTPQQASPRARDGRRQQA
ncbi:MAG: hypothetical protein ACLRMJ_04165 [Alistipes finegoldii]